MAHTTVFRSTKITFNSVSAIIRCKMFVRTFLETACFNFHPSPCVFPVLFIIPCLSLASQAQYDTRLYWLRFSEWSAQVVCWQGNMPAWKKERKNISICCILDNSYGKRKGIYSFKRGSLWAFKKWVSFTSTGGKKKKNVKLLQDLFLFSLLFCLLFLKHLQSEPPFSDNSTTQTPVPEGKRDRISQN